MFLIFRYSWHNRACFILSFSAIKAQVSTWVWMCSGQFCLQIRLHVCWRYCFCVSPRFACIKENLFRNSCWGDYLCRSFISAPLWSFSSLVWPCESVKGQAPTLLDVSVLFKKALKDAQHVYTLYTNNKGRLRHKGTPAWTGWSSAYHRGWVKMHASESLHMIVSWIPLTGQ